MEPTTAMQLVRAGIQLYPMYGYHQLTGQVIAKHLNIDVSVYDSMFPEKDDFFKLVLIEFRDCSLGRFSFDFAPQMPPVERLRQIVWRLAVALRSHLDWTHRMLLDSVAGVKIISKAIRIQNEMIALGLLSLLRECYSEECVSEVELKNRYEFLQGAVLMPIIMSNRNQKFGMLPEDICGNLPDLMTDSYIHQRIDWAFKALFD